MWTTLTKTAYIKWPPLVRLPVRLPACPRFYCPPNANSPSYLGGSGASGSRLPEASALNIHLSRTIESVSQSVSSQVISCHPSLPLIDDAPRAKLLAVSSSKMTRRRVQ